MTTTTMDPLVLTDARIWLAGGDLTGFSNKVDTSMSLEDLDKTTFGSGGAKERTGGLFDVDASCEFFWDAGDASKPDDLFWANLGRRVAWTVAPTLGTVGSLAYLSRVLTCSYKPGADVGKLLAGTAELKGDWPLVRGLILHPAGTARTATGSGTAVQLGAIPANKALYVSLHVLSVAADSGTPTLAVAVQSDDSSGFSSATTRTTFSTVSVPGGQVAKVSGAVTDDWWRASWTIAGGATNPSVLFVVAAGLGPK